MLPVARKVRVAEELMERLVEVIQTVWRLAVRMFLKLAEAMLTLIAGDSHQLIVHLIVVRYIVGVVLTKPQVEAQVPAQGLRNLSVLLVNVLLLLEVVPKNPVRV